jgi:imidazolonepropionase
LCDQEIFRIEESQAVLEEGKKIGLNINFHGNQSLQAVEMGAKIGSKAISRLEDITIEEISQVEKSETVLIILPSTSHMHRLNESTVRKLIDREKGCIVCLATDFSPNSYCYSMVFLIFLKDFF